MGSRANHWNLRIDCATKPKVEKSKMAASKLQMQVSASVQDINEILMAIPMFSGSNISSGLMRTLCNQPEKVKF